MGKRHHRLNMPAIWGFAMNKNGIQIQAEPDISEAAPTGNDVGGELAKDSSISTWEKIGRYAIGLQFSDGHKTGIYTYDRLRSLCQCDLCDKNVIRIQGALK